MKKITFVGIPFYTLAKYQGMASSVSALRDAGIVQALGSQGTVRDLGDVDCPQIQVDHGPKNLQNFDQFLEGTRNVKDKLSNGADGSSITFCLGGECTFIVGSVAALKKVYRGKPGIVWMDAHGDFNTPETTPSGFIGGMCLAMACGKGPKLSEDIEASRPLLDVSRTVHVGSRALDSGESEALRNSATVFDASTVRSQGAKRIGRELAGLLEDSSDWIIAHLDVDVMDPSIMPGVNFPETRGLIGKDIIDIIGPLRSTGKLRVVDITAYNPAMDKNGQGQSLLLDLAPRCVGPN